MTIVQRRTFYGKVGKGSELIQHLQEGNVMARGAGMAIKPRVLSDYHSGRTDRVAVEWEVESYQELEALETEMWQDERDEEMFEQWFARLTELIEYAEVETWRVH